MAWATPEYSRRKVDQAGRTFVDSAAPPEERELALTVITNWRSSHSYPLNTVQMNLRRVATQLDHDPTVAQRIKRLPSIRHKLQRFSKMDLSRMQDLGGCRAVLSSVDAVDELVGYYTEKSRMKHRLIREDPYISEPKSSGYRGTHLVYSYFSDSKDDWNGLKIEIQVRSRLQHAWATAVETVGTFTRQALKSSWGEDEWLRFFALISSALALREGTPLVPGTPSDPGELKRELRRYARQLNVIRRLNAYGAALRIAEAPLKGELFLLELSAGHEPESMELQVRSYQDSVRASAAYDAIERAIAGDPDKDAVLVRVESLASLRRAYPNYFVDTTAFVESLREAIE
jgi:hypothetical protein